MAGLSDTITTPNLGQGKEVLRLLVSYKLCSFKCDLQLRNRKNSLSKWNSVTAIIEEDSTPTPKITITFFSP